MNNKQIQPILSLCQELQEKKIIQTIIDSSSFFYDEPYFYAYSPLFANPKNYYSKDTYIATVNNLSATGVSFTSKRIALTKCVGETIERFCSCCYRKDHIFFSDYQKLTKNSLIDVLNPRLYKDNKRIEKELFGWVNGVNLTKNIKCIIPAQLVYLNYYHHNEIRLGSSISSGTAGEFIHEQTLLNGIYEVVERDAIMTMYLNKIPVKLINLENIKDKNINTIIKTFERYRLEVHTYDITNDLGIPVYLTILVDKSGHVPQITLGAKSSFNMLKAIIGSLEEAWQTRPYIRKEFFKKKYINSINNQTKIQIRTIFDRACFWAIPNNKKKLDFLLKQRQTDLKIIPFTLNRKEELNYLIGVISKKGFQIYYTDITLNNFKKLGYLVYKVVIPGLQPLYLDETRREWKLERLKTVAKYFGKRKFAINSFPHPFL